jgi:hypothetical protein
MSVKNNPISLQRRSPPSETQNRRLVSKRLSFASQLGRSITPFERWTPRNAVCKGYLCPPLCYREGLAAIAESPVNRPSASPRGLDQNWKNRRHAPRPPQSLRPHRH